MWNTTGIGDRARLVADIYYHAELALLRKMADDMAKLSAVDNADVVSLRRLFEFETTAGQVYSEAHWLVLADMEDLLDGLQAQEYAAATGNLAELGYAPRVMPDQISSVELIAADIASTVSAIPARALRNAVDAYQQVQAYASGQVALGALTRLDASQWALDDFARQGIAKMTDRAGRNWRADTYAEMTVRTGAMNAIIETHLDAYQQHGVDLVLVSDSAHECDMCRPWEYKVLTMTGTAGRYQVADQLTGGTTVVDVAGNIGDARAQGLFHPNCGHSVAPYIPGATYDVPTRDNPELYEATQDQRRIERHIRDWKRRHSVSVTHEAHSKASAKLEKWERELKDLLDDYPELRRRPERENPFSAR